MNPYWEQDKSLSSRAHVLPKGEVTAVASNLIRPRQGILEATRIDDGHKDADTCRKPNARAHSYPIYLHKYLNKEKAYGRRSAVGKLHPRHNSRVISDIPPLQPRRRHKMSGEPSSVSLKESHKDPGAGDSKWNSGSGVLTDRPPLLPFIRHGISEASCASTQEYHNDPKLEEPRLESSIRRLHQRDGSRWSSGSFDMAPFHALAGSSIRRLQQSDDSSWSSGYRTT
jgi:hypothetical protein